MLKNIVGLHGSLFVAPKDSSFPPKNTNFISWQAFSALAGIKSLLHGCPVRRGMCYMDLILTEQSR